MSNEPVKTFHVVLHASTFYAEVIEAASAAAAEDRMRELWTENAIQPDHDAEEIKGIQAEIHIDDEPEPASLVPDQPLQRFRISYTDHRFYYYDVDAVDAETAEAEADRRAEGGDVGTDHKKGTEYALWFGTEEVHS